MKSKEIVLFVKNSIRNGNNSKGWIIRSIMWMSLDLSNTAYNGSYFTISL